MSGPIRLTPSYREKIWGRRRLSPWFEDSDKLIGEVWYLADHELPLLVKLIFTSERLSIQVHPADGEAGPYGKTEMWYVLEAEPGASIAVGFREAITREQLRTSARTGEIEQLVRWIPVKPGDTVLNPAHTVHAIGGGLALFEIQQNSDVTYRLWDYGRPRETHMEEAAVISDLGIHPGISAPTPLAPGREELVRCPYFVTELISLKPGETITPPSERSHLWMVIEGQGTIGGQPFRPGEVWLMPDSGPQHAIESETGARLLRAYVP